MSPEALPCSRIKILPIPINYTLYLLKMSKNVKILSLLTQNFTINKKLNFIRIVKDFKRA